MAMSFSINANRCKYPESQFQKIALFFLAMVFFSFAANAQAQTWLSGPGTGDWNTASNWSSPSVPNAQSAFATFGTSGITNVSLSSGVSVDTIQFNGGASAFTINTNLNNVLALFGSGIVNNSSAIQSLAVGSGGEMDFYNTSTAGNAQITSNSFINFFSNSNAGTASIMNNATANLRFFANSSAESALITNNGVFDFLDNATAGDSNITNNGNLVFTGQGNGISFSTAGNAAITNNNAMSFNNYSMAGNSIITNSNTGTLVFNENSTTENSTIINSSGGTFDFKDDSTAAHSNITNSGNLDFTGQGNGVSFSTAGNATITNNNTMLFNDYSTAANSTITNASAGVVTFYDDTTAGNSNITNDGNLVFTGQSNGISFSTAGQAAITNNNQVNFNDYSTAGNSILANGSSGTLNFNNNSTAGNAGIVNNFEVFFYNNATAGFGNVVNNHAVSFEDNSTAGNADITNNAGLVFSNNSTAGSATITTNLGYAFFQNSASGGTARFIFNGSANLGIYAETTGTVTIGSLEGSGSVSLGTNNLTTGLNNLNTSYSGIIGVGGVGGSLTKIGTGTFTLSGTNIYTGGTDISTGTLVAANSGALGTGSVVVNGGTLSLDGPRTLSIGGNYTQTFAGTLQLGLGGTSIGQWDNLNVTGASNLAGTLNLVSYNGFHGGVDETFELLDATGGLSGRFGTIVDSIYEPVSIIYTPNQVILNTMTYSQFALTTNEKNVADDLDNLAVNSEDTALLNTLTALPAPSLTAVYDQISPSNLTPLYRMRFMASQAQGELVWQRFSELWKSKNFNSTNVAWDNQSPMFASAMPAEQEAQIGRGFQPNPWGGFLSEIGNFGTVNSDGNGAGYQFSTRGTTAGVDYRMAKELAGGLLIGYDDSGSDQSTGTVNMTGGQLGLYTGWKSDDFHIEALIDAGIDSYTTQRTAFDGAADGSTSSLEYSGLLNVGYDIPVGDFEMDTFLSGQFTQVNVNGFNETGSLAPLTFTNQSEAYLDSDLGFQLSDSWKVGKMKLSPSLNAAWEHVYQGNLDSLIANFGTGNNFAVYGSGTGTDAAVLGGGLKAEFPRGFSVYFDYQGKQGMTNYTEQSFTGGINVAFGDSESEKVYGDRTKVLKAVPTVSPSMRPAVSLPLIQSQTVSVAPSPAATPVVTVLPAPTPRIVPVKTHVVAPMASPTTTSWSLGPLVPTQGIIEVETPTATPAPVGSGNHPF